MRSSLACDAKSSVGRGKNATDRGERLLDARARDIEMSARTQAVAEHGDHHTPRAQPFRKLGRGNSRGVGVEIDEVGLRRRDRHALDLREAAR